MKIAKGLALAIGFVLIPSGLAWSASDPFEQCAVKKVKASRDLFKCLVKANTKIFTKNLNAGEAEQLREVCLQKHTRQIGKAVQRAARKGVECSTVDQEELVAAIQAQAQEVVDRAVTPNKVESEEEGEFIGGRLGAMAPTCQCIRGNGNVGSCDGLTVAVRCVYGREEGSQLGLNLELLRTILNSVLAQRGSGLEIGLASPVVMEAWGGFGGRGANDYFIVKTCDGGGGGRGGYARTTRSYSEVLSEAIGGLLYLYVGREGALSNERGGRGGASSILMGRPITDSGPGWFPILTNVLVIGGGGGGGGSCGSTLNGRGGGAGGCGIARRTFMTSSCTIGSNGDFASAPGSNGGGDGSGGEGGNQNGAGFGGGLAGESRSGERGIGGFGGRNQNDNGWIGWEGSDLTHADWPFGSGGTGIKSTGIREAGGGGGGGFGGGQGGRQGGSGFRGGGGGGAGSWAKGATAAEFGLPFLGQDGPPGRHGAVALTFGVEPAGSSTAAQP